MIVVTFALPAESSAFVRKLRNVRRDRAIIRAELPAQNSNAKLEISPSPQSSPRGREDSGLSSGNYTCEFFPPHQTSNIKHQTSVCVFHTGVGARECEERLNPFFERGKSEAEIGDAALAAMRHPILISSGFCGATVDRLAPGDLVIAENYSDAHLAKLAHKLVPKAIFGELFSSDQVIHHAADRYRIGREHGALAVDMETATIAKICAVHGVPMLSLRAVSDSPEAPFPVPAEVLFDIKQQRTRYAHLLLHLAREPAALRRLARFSKQVALARRRLAEAVCALFAVI